MQRISVALIAPINLRERTDYYWSIFPFSPQHFSGALAITHSRRLSATEIFLSVLPKSSVIIDELGSTQLRPPIIAH